MLPLRTECTVTSHTLGRLLTSMTVSSNIKTRKTVFVLVRTTPSCFVETDKFTVPCFWLDAIFVPPYIATSWKQNNLASHLNSVWSKCNYVCLFHNPFINSRESNYCQDIWHILSPSQHTSQVSFCPTDVSQWAQQRAGGLRINRNPGGAKFRRLTWSRTLQYPATDTLALQKSRPKHVCTLQPADGRGLRNPKDTQMCIEDLWQHF